MDYKASILSSGVLEALVSFDPRVVGTLPLGISVPESDIDIVCYAYDQTAFIEAIWERFRLYDDFAIHQWTSGTRAVIARFKWEGWPFEIFGETSPVDHQPGFVHFDVERRLLDLDDGRLRAAIVRQRALGIKTEPAFAAVLGLTGDPYLALLELARESDDGLHTRLARVYSDRERR
jgi:hypothetical protein